MTTRDRVMVWKFDMAPPELQVLHNGAGSPNWIALVPAAIHGPDLQEAIVAQTGRMGIEEYRTEAGDVVYVGSCDLTQFLELVGKSRSEPMDHAARS